MWKQFNKTDRRILSTAVVLLLLMLYLLYDDSLILPSDESKNLSHIGEIAQAEQDVRRKISKKFVWRSARNNDRVYLGDSLFTGKDSSAVIRLKDGRTLTVEPNSLIVFNHGGDQLNLDLKFGRVAGKIDGCMKVNVKGIQKEVCGKNSQIEIDSEGSVQTETPALPQDAIAWFQAPAEVFYHLKNKTPLKASWKVEQSFSRYFFQMSRQKDFKTIVFEEKLKQQQIETFRYPAKGEFYVRVRGDDLKGKPLAFSPIARIEIRELPPIQITYPRPQQRFTFRTGFDGELLDVNRFEVRWSYPLKDSAFDLQIAKDPNYKDIVAQNTKVRSYQLAFKDFANGHYYVRVRESTNDSPVRPWSSSIPFAVEKLKPPRMKSPELLTENIKFLAPSEKPVTLKWEPIDEADQYVVEASDKPDFSEKTTFTTNNESFTLPEIKPGKAYFRVYAATEKGTLGEPSTTGSVQVKVKEPVLSSVSPIDLMGKTPEDPGDPQEVDATWTDLKFAKSYEVQISEDEKFQTKTEVITDKPSAKLTIPKPGQFYWRVRGLDQEGKPLTSFSQKGELKYNLRVPLAMPEIQEPLDQMTMYYQNNTEPYIWFEWSPVRQASHYNFEVALDPDFQNKVVSKVLTTPRYHLKEKLSGPLYWRVQAQNQDNRISHWTPTRTLTILSGRGPAGRGNTEKRK